LEPRQGLKIPTVHYTESLSLWYNKSHMGEILGVYSLCKRQLMIINNEDIKASSLGGLKYEY